jgi:hypothetical protein
VYGRAPAPSKTKSVLSDEDGVPLAGGAGEARGPQLLAARLARSARAIDVGDAAQLTIASGQMARRRPRLRRRR